MNAMLQNKFPGRLKAKVLIESISDERILGRTEQMGKEIRNHIIDDAVNLRPIVIHTKNVFEKSDLKFDTPQSLPFETCSIEAHGNSAITSLRFEEGAEPSLVWCIVFREINPARFAYAVLSSTGENLRVRFGESDYFDKDSTGSVFAQLLIEILSRKDMVTGEERVRETFKRNGKNVKFRTIVHIRSQKKENEAPSVYGGPIDWSHRWEVRGHWRAIAGLGKNRAGEYCVAGHTWVVPHEKGAPGIAVKKTRFLAVTP